MKSRCRWTLLVRMCRLNLAQHCPKRHHHRPLVSRLFSFPLRFEKRSHDRDDKTSLRQTKEGVSKKTSMILLSYSILALTREIIPHNMLNESPHFSCYWFGQSRKLVCHVSNCLLILNLVVCELVIHIPKLMIVSKYLSSQHSIGNGISCLRHEAEVRISIF